MSVCMIYPWNRKALPFSPPSLLSKQHFQLHSTVCRLFNVAGIAVGIILAAIALALPLLQFHCRCCCHCVGIAVIIALALPVTGRQTSIALLAVSSQERSAWTRAARHTCPIRSETRAMVLSTPGNHGLEKRTWTFLQQHLHERTASHRQVWIQRPAVQLARLCLCSAGGVVDAGERYFKMIPCWTTRLVLALSSNL